jgi:hypothetical protein
MTDIKKRRIIKEEELIVPEYTKGECTLIDACINFSQDEEYLILGYNETKP